MYKSIIKKIFLSLITLSGPISLLLYLNLEEIILPVLLVTITVFTFYLVCKKQHLLLLVSIFIIFFIVLSLIIIPYSFYIAWFQIISTKIPEGIITNTIIYIIVYIWSLFWGTFAKKGELTLLLKLVIFLLLILSFVLKTKIIYLCLFITISLNIFTNILKVKRYEKILSLFIIGVIISFLSILIFNTTSGNGSNFIDDTAYNFRKIINSNIPNFNLLSSIPGLTNNYSDNTGKTPILGSKSLFKINGTPGERYYLRLKIGKYGKENLASNKIDIKKISSIRSFKLTVLADFLPVLPTTLNTKAISGFIIPENTSNTLKLSLPLTRGEFVRFYIGELDYIEDKPIVNIPNTSKEVKNLALSLKGNTELETAKNIRKYLLDNYTYNLETQESPTYITDFLFNTKEGFCIHFARSFILLAELNGIASREISGYIVDIVYPKDEFYRYNNTYGETIVTGKDAHLWPEIFIDNKWVTFEVTPSVFREANEDLKNRTIENKSNVILEYDEKINGKQNLKILWFYIIFILSILLTSIILISRYKKKYIKRLVKKCSKKGIPHPKEIGWVRWNEIVTNSIEYESIFLEIFYKNRSLTVNEELKLKKLIKSL